MGKRMFLKSVKNERGFTLIEAMVVVVLIGVLAAIAVPVYNTYIGRARCGEAINLLGGAIQDAESFFAFQGTYAAYVLPANLSANAGEFGLGIQAAGGAANITFRATGGVAVGAQLGTADWVQVVVNNAAQDAWTDAGACTNTAP